MNDLTKNNVWFCSDTHFCHSNIIKYCNRPFVSAGEMNEVIINNWRDKINHGDYVFFLGDLVFANSESSFNWIFHQLTGKIIMVKGNHDKASSINRKKFYSFYEGFLEIDIEGQQITLCHYPMLVWNKSHYGAWMLHGHCHGTLPDDKYARRIDVGVDANNFSPMSFWDVEKKMKEKIFKPIDHHKGNFVDS